MKDECSCSEPNTEATSAEDSREILGTLRSSGDYFLQQSSPLLWTLFNHPYRNQVLLQGLLKTTQRVWVMLLLSKTQTRINTIPQKKQQKAVTATNLWCKWNWKRDDSLKWSISKKIFTLSSTDPLSTHLCSLSYFFLPISISIYWFAVSAAFKTIAFVWQLKFI